MWAHEILVERWRRVIELHRGDNIVSVISAWDFDHHPSFDVRGFYGVVANYYECAVMSWARVVLIRRWAHVRKRCEYRQALLEHRCLAEDRTTYYYNKSRIIDVGA